MSSRSIQVLSPLSPGEGRGAGTACCLLSFQLYSASWRQIDLWTQRRWVQTADLQGKTFTWTQFHPWNPSHPWRLPESWLVFWERAECLASTFLCWACCPCSCQASLTCRVSFKSLYVFFLLWLWNFVTSSSSESAGRQSLQATD